MRTILLLMAVSFCCVGQNAVAMGDTLRVCQYDSVQLTQDTTDILCGEGDSSWYGGQLGLVLSGGGARGLAHIGVLRALDEMGVRPDYITGTSMGAVIGGLYAMGYTGEQISQLNREADWNVLLSRTIDMRKVAFDQKSSFSRSVFSIGLRGRRFRFKLGYIEGQNLWDFFFRLTWPAVKVQRFDSLAIPFRCCAGDVLRGECCVLDSGSLAVAMRASMSVPGVFTPVVTRDKRVYVDGGVCDNLPIDAALAMGADRVIGVNVSTQNAYEYTSSLGIRRILNNSAMYFGIRKAQDDLRRCDVAIEPNLEGMMSSTFSSGREIEQRGYLAALAQREEIMQLARRMGRKVGVGAPCGFDMSRLLDSVAIDTIVVELESLPLRRFAQNASQLKAPSKITQANMQRASDNLIGSGYFTHCIYYVDEQRRLHLLPQPAPRFEMSFAANVNDAWGASAIVRMRMLNPFTNVSRLDVAAMVTAQPKLDASYTTYVSPRMKAFVRFDLDYTSEKLPYYVNNQNVASVWKHGVGAQGFIGYMPMLSLTMDLGARYSFVSQIPNKEYNTWVGLKSVGKYRQQSLRLFFDVRCNTLTRPYFPERGQSVVASVAYLFNSPLKSYSSAGKEEAKKKVQSDLDKPHQFYSINFRYRGTFSMWNAVYLEPSLVLGLNSRTTGRFSSYLVGGGCFTVRDEFGDVPFYGIGYRQLSASDVWGAAFDLRIRLWKELFFVTRVNYAQLNDTMAGLFRSFTSPKVGLLGGGAAVAWMTPLGPMAVSASLANQAQKVWFNFSLGYTF